MKDKNSTPFLLAHQEEELLPHNPTTYMSILLCPIFKSFECISPISFSFTFRGSSLRRLRGPPVEPPHAPHWWECPWQRVEFTKFLKKLFQDTFIVMSSAMYLHVNSSHQLECNTSLWWEWEFVHENKRTSSRSEAHRNGGCSVHIQLHDYVWNGHHCWGLKGIKWTQRWWYKRKVIDKIK